MNKVNVVPGGCWNLGTERLGLHRQALGFVWQSGFQESADVFSNSSRSRAKNPKCSAAVKCQAAGSAENVVKIRAFLAFHCC